MCTQQHLRRLACTMLAQNAAEPCVWYTVADTRHTVLFVSYSKIHIIKERLPFRDTTAVEGHVLPCLMFSTIRSALLKIPVCAIAASRNAVVSFDRRTNITLTSTTAIFPGARERFTHPLPRTRGFSFPCRFFVQGWAARRRDTAEEMCKSVYIPAPIRQVTPTSHWTDFPVRNPPR